MRKTIQNIIIILLLFLFIYYPPIFPFNTLHVLGSCSWLIIIVKKKQILFSKIFLRMLLTLMITIAYIGSIALVNNSSLAYVYTYLVWIFDIFPFLLIFTNYLKQNYSIKDFYFFILIAGNLQGIIALLCFLFKDVQSIVINMLIRYGFSDVLITLSEFRIFGLTYNFTYTMPIVQSVLAIVSIYLAINYKISYVIFSPLLIFSGVINARISITVLFIGVLFIIISSLKKMNQNTIRCILVLFIELITSYFLISYIQTKSENTFEWILDGYKDILSLLGIGNYNGYYSQYITNSSKYILPEGIKVLFGKGTSIMSSVLDVRSDIGFINDIWLGGIIYVIIIYSFWIYFIMKIHNKNIKDTFVLSIFLVCIFFMVDFKGNIVSINEFTNLLFLFIYYHGGNAILRKNNIKGE